jgi:TRAP-type mannitol/chloroaromatic compound transport system substrate-binding protein
MPTQPLGWFKKQVRGPEDLKNIKFRTVGLSADLFKLLGASVTILPGGQVVPAIGQGLIDGAEFNNPSSDRVLGFPDVSKIYMLQSYHQNVECFEIIFNKSKFDALPAEQKAILRHGAEAASSDMFWKAQDRYTKDLDEMRRRQGVQTHRTPRSVLDAQLASWDKLIDELSGNPYAKRVIESQRAWGRRVAGFFLEYQSPVGPAYNHFFVRRR